MSRFITLGAADRIETPDTAALQIVGDLDMRADIIVPTATGVWQMLDTRNGNAGYTFALRDTGGGSYFVRDGDGSTENNDTSSAHGMVVGTRHETKATMDISSGTWDYLVDGASFDTGDLGGAITPVAGEIPLYVAFSDWAGSFYFMEVRAGIGGTVAARCDAEDAFDKYGVGALSTGSFWTDAVSGLVWTVTGAGASVGEDVTVSGTAVAGGVTEAEITAGGETIVLTLGASTWVATVGDDNGITDALIAGIDSGGAEAAGWDAVVKANMVHGDVERTSDTVVTITLAAEAAYLIDNDETITVTVPATATVSDIEIVASPTFDVTAEAAAAISGTVVAGGVAEAEIVAGGETLIITLTGDIWHDDMGSDDASTTALIAGITSAGTETFGWNNVVKANLAFGDIARTSDKIVTVTLGAEPTYQITQSETITVTVPTAAIDGDTVIVAAPTFAVTRLAPPGEGTYAGVGPVAALRARLTADGYTPVGNEPAALVAQIVGSTIESEVLGHLRASAGATKRETLAALHEVIAADGGTITDIGEVDSALVRFAEVYDL